jgi:hypothetical protein
MAQENKEKPPFFGGKTLSGCIEILIDGTSLGKTSFNHCVLFLCLLNLTNNICQDSQIFKTVFK